MWLYEAGHTTIVVGVESVALPCSVCLVSDVLVGLAELADSGAFCGEDDSCAAYASLTVGGCLA